MFYCQKLSLCCVLDRKRNGLLKMIKFSSSSYGNEIHIVDSHFNEDSKNVIFFQESPDFGERRPENLQKIDNNRDIYCHENRGGQFLKRISVPAKILLIPQISHMPDQILGDKRKNSIFRPKFDLSLGVLPSQNLRTYSQIFHMTKCLML